MAMKKTAQKKTTKPAKAPKVYDTFGKLVRARGQGTARGLRIEIQASRVVARDQSGHVRLDLGIREALRQLIKVEFARVTLSSEAGQ